jgi:heme-degrading monooxygenase HmoA
MFANTPQPPYYAVIFSSQRTPGDEGYQRMAARMEELAALQPGYLGMESVRDAAGFGITVSYWASEAAIVRWRSHVEHLVAQELGKQVWYERYALKVARVERAYGGPVEHA